MAPRTGAETKRRMPVKQSRSQRNLATVLAVLLLPTFLGLGYLLYEFLASSRRANTVIAAAMARDTIALSAYDQSVNLFYVAQEVYEEPSKREFLRASHRRFVNSLDSLRAAFKLLLPRAPRELQPSIQLQFEGLWRSIDLLVGHCDRVFTPPEDSAVRSPAPPPQMSKRDLVEGARAESFLPDANSFFRRMRVRLDELLRAELAEDMIQARDSQAYVERITYRGFAIAFFLLAVGVTLAVILTRRGRLFEQRRRRYQTIVEHSMNPIQVVDRSGEITYVNPAFESWSGESRKSLLGRRAFEGVRPLDQSMSKTDFWTMVLERITSGRSWSGEVEIHRTGKETAYTMLIVSPIVDERVGLLECIAIHHDITERKELARKFEESQEKYQDIVEGSLEGIVIVQGGRVVFANASAAKIFGYNSEEEMREVRFSENVAPASRHISFAEDRDSVVGEDILRNCEIKGLSSRGEIIDLEVNARFVLWNDKPAVQASFRDISERKLLERELALWLWEQETLSTIDRKLVSSVDLRIVLNVICFQAKALTRADWTGVMMVDLMTSLVRWRSVKGNRLPMREEPFHLGAVHRDIVQKRDPFVMQDLGSNPDLPIDEFPPFKDEEIISAVRFPLIVDKEIRGQLVVGFRQHHDFSPREVRLLGSLAEKSSIALANAQLYDNLLAREKELELLSGARARAQEEERRRIAREIHDSLGQLLTAIKFNVEILEDAVTLQDGENRRRLHDTKALLDSAMAGAREISYDLMPSVLIDFGLVPALQFLCEQSAKRSGLAVQFHADGVESRLDPTMEIGLYRISQEALTNIAKHAGAREASVQFIRSSKNLRLLIEDDGKGFQVDPFDPRRAKRHGLGLISMRERAESFDGTFTIESSPGRGTVIIVEIPLTNLSENGKDSHTSG